MLILLITHICIAVAGLAIAAAALVKLSESLIKTAYALTGGTIATGTLLVIVSQGNILKSCLSGLGYLAVILALVAAAKYRLAVERL